MACKNVKQFSKAKHIALAKVPGAPVGPKLAEGYPIRVWINKVKINRTSKVTHLSPSEHILKHF